jgi:hypothetical protein
MSYFRLLSFFSCLIAFSCAGPPTEQTTVVAPVQSSQNIAASSETNSRKSVASTDSLAESNVLPGECQASFTYEVREPAVTGQANVFIGVAKWNAATEVCWDNLAEYYYNITPAAGVTLQKAYFIAEPAKREAKKISSWSQMTQEVKQRVIGVAIYDRKADTLYFEEHPFRGAIRR